MRRSAAVGGFKAGTGFPLRAAVTTGVTVNLVLVVITIAGFVASDPGYDWFIYQEAGRRIVNGGLYDWSGAYAWSYSPLLAYAFAALAPIGFWGWGLLHVAATGLLQSWRLAAIALISWPFWADVYNGNTMTFVFVAAAGALRGHAAGIGVYLIMCTLMPRPIMLPMLLWILVTQPAWRWRFALIVVISVALVMLTGYGATWVGALLRVSDAVAISDRDVGPAVFLGTLWLPLGAAAAAWFWWRGHLGLASIAVSPYWLPQYLLMLGLEFAPRDGDRGPDRDASPGRSVRPSPSADPGAERGGAGEAA